MNMVRIIMDCINRFKILPKKFCHKLSYHLEGFFFRNLIFLKRKNEMVALPFIQLSKMTFGIYHLG